MHRIHLFEFTDLPWYPDVFRRIQTDYLQFVVGLASTGTPVFEYTYLVGYPQT